MPDLTVFPVLNRKQRRQFLRFPWQLYRKDPCWIPPLQHHQKELLGFAAHPFYEAAESQTFLATSNGVVCGRISAILNHAHNHRHKEQRGFWGFFESVDDRAVAHRLFDAAWNWLQERGAQTFRGPVNPSMNYECGLLVDGFDTPPSFMMAYNPPYYSDLVESWGLRKSQDLLSFWGHIAMLGSLNQKLDFVIDECKRRFNIRLRRFRPERLQEEVHIFLEIYNQSLGGTWGFVPLSNAEVRHLAGALRHLLVPELTAIAEIDQHPVAAVVGLLDYNPLLKRINGRLLPWGFLNLRFRRRQITRTRIVSTNVLPEYQRWGVGLVALNRLLPDALAWGIQEGEFSWVLESNHLSRSTLERAGAQLSKTYRLYDLDEVPNRT
ncbi:MAG: N-acetyltransferase [Planctomycetaceae bacterium]|nr:N-acetyltransferase [Planctomycetaceae bacterium]MBP61387.1 N-acetyltransferase [Planctomycetaceae bacterium]